MLVSVVIALVAAASSLSGKAAVARPAPTTLHIDGDLTEWNPGLFSASAPIDIDEGSSVIEEGAIASNRDHSARAYLTFTPTALVVGALITDDDVVERFRGEDMWQGDLLEVILARPASNSVLHIGVNPVGDVHVFSPSIPDTAMKNIGAAARVEKGGWVVEVSIPFTAFGADSKTPTLQFNLGFKDADTQEQPVAHRVWSGQRHQLRASMATLYFDRRVAPSFRPNCASPSKTLEVKAPLRATGPRLNTGADEVTLRIINFQSSTENWPTFWSNFRPEQIRADLEVAKKLRANAIRIFIFDNVFGLEVVSPEMLERLHFVVQEAAARGLLSIVTFFPFKKEFRREWYARMQQHLERIVGSFVDDPAIAMWDLMNEPDHMWALADGGVTSADVASWATTMYRAVKQADRSHLVTVGLAGHFLNTQDALERDEQGLLFVDVISFHFYGELQVLETTLARARALKKPLVLQEFGVSSLYATEDEAADTLGAICASSAKARLNGVGIWELFDHPVGSLSHVSPRWSETVENDFGLVTSDGRFKKQAQKFCECLTSQALKIAPMKPPPSPRSPVEK